MNVVKIKGTCLIPLGPAFSLTTPKITPYNASNTDCQLFFGSKLTVVTALVKRNVIKIKPNESQIVEVFKEKIRYESSLVLTSARSPIVFP